MKRWVIAVIVIIVLVAGFFAVRQFRARQASVQAGLQTVPAGRGDLTATVGATGVVRANQTALLFWQTSGSIAQVNVSVGDQVTATQVLAVLDRTSLPQNVILAQADLVNAQKSLEDLLDSGVQQAKALQALEDAQQALDDARNPELSQAKAQEAIATAQKAVEDAQNALRWAQSPASQSLIDQAKAQVVIAKDQLDQAKEKFAPYANKPEDDLTRANLQSKLSEAQQQYDAAVRKLNSLQGTASQTQQDVLKANLETAQAQLEQAQRDYERIKDGTSPAQVALLEAQLEDARREWERLKDGPNPGDVAVAEARVAAAQATLNLDRITAPFGGTVTAVISKTGDQVSPGSQGFQIDDLSHLLLDVQVSEVDINRIQPSQQVSLTFDAIPNKEYHGKVSQVARVGTSDQGIVDFTVTVELMDADVTIKPGMTAAVNIVVDQLQDVLLVPNRAVRVVDGQRVVYVLRGVMPEPITVTLGASSDTMSQVLESDLKVGDQIVLNPPIDFSQFGQGGPGGGGSFRSGGTP